MVCIKVNAKRRSTSSNGESDKPKEADVHVHYHGSIDYWFRLLLCALASVMSINIVDNDKNAYQRIPLLPVPLVPAKGAAFARFSVGDAASMLRRHPVPCVLAFSLLFFMGVEYTLHMVPTSSPPVDVGFVLTRHLHGVLVTRRDLNSALAALNTVFVVMQIAYILWNFLVEGRSRSTIAALFMFTCRGILGYSTQLPLPEGFLGSGVDFPVGNVSFFLFFSGHVGGSIIASQDMRRMRRHGMAWTFHVLNVLQVLRLLATRGHYTIDLAAGLGAGFLFDILAGEYEEWKKHCSGDCNSQNIKN